MRAIRVLLAEDEALTAEALRADLTASGFAILAAADGQAALDIADGHGFDVLLTDLRMPRVDGGELIRRLRRRRPNLPVVVMTSYGAGEDAAVLRGEAGQGPVRLLTKPVRVTEVVAAVIDVAGTGTHH